MGKNEEEGQHTLSLPKVENNPFSRNFIHTAVCEIRFPILTALRAKALPDAFFAVFRKPYPFYKQNLVVTPGLSDPEPNHSFKSRDQTWTVSIRPWAFSLETKNYKSFEDFIEKLEKVSSDVIPLLDTGFFTRIGLRYINILPVSRYDLDGWLNPRIEAPLKESGLGYLLRAWTEAVGTTGYGKYNLRYGFPDETHEKFVLDIDLYVENIDIEQLEPVLPQLHELSFNLFHWCLGEKALKYLAGN